LVVEPSFSFTRYRFGGFESLLIFVIMRWIEYLIGAAFVAFSEASTLTPPVIPLIVRNPYLSTWLGHARELPWEHWPIFWTGQEVGLSILAAVPATNDVYPLLGRPQDSLPKSDQRSVGSCA
jgi:hypothetical protein